MIFVYPDTISTFTGDRAIALSSGYVEVSKEDYDDLVKTKKMWKKDKLVVDPTYEERKREEEEEEEKRRQEEAHLTEIATLKKSLADTDYKAIKFAEGWITTEDYEETKQARQAWRDRINELEAQS